MVDSLTKLCIIAPCYNEEEILESSVEALENTIESLVNEGLISQDSFLVLVDDGSKDKTWPIMESLKEKYGKKLKAIKLAGNCGHQFALLSGLLTVSNEVDCAISIDVDLQDDIGVMKDMVVLHNNGFEVVYGVRKQRITDTFFKRFTAEFFYKLMLFLGVKIVYNHADYRLTGARVLRSLENFTEVNLFLRGLFPAMGYKSAEVYYDRKERTAGESKFPLHKMMAFAWEGITSFSVQPLRLIFYSGLIIFAASALFSCYVFYAYLQNESVRGWSSLMLSIYFIGSIQLMAMGIIGEYIGKIYKETKRRPRFIIDKII